MNLTRIRFLELHFHQDDMKTRLFTTSRNFHPTRIPHSALQSRIHIFTRFHPKAENHTSPKNPLFPKTPKNPLFHTAAEIGHFPQNAKIPKNANFAFFAKFAKNGRSAKMGKFGRSAKMAKNANFAKMPKNGLFQEMAKNGPFWGYPKFRDFRRPATNTPWRLSRDLVLEQSPPL